VDIKDLEVYKIPLKVHWPNFKTNL